jgi:hypothetical protein
MTCDLLVRIAVLGSSPIFLGIDNVDAAAHIDLNAMTRKSPLRELNQSL